MTGAAEGLPLADALALFFAERVEDDITQRINDAAYEVHAEWHGRPNRNAYVNLAIREAAYRAVESVLSREYVTVLGRTS